ncbi:Signal transduction histidine kinase [uncultured Desulfatiglans sp.]|uniref:histidine kinase n=1 Tax=Uncultured Desulfatiglans sp. TaxID=1748965 RepID=A0A653ADN4_UNCDX|nr:Signal transduction histidine kinase [uncultured Desulfatiglans sp.]
MFLDRMRRITRTIGFRLTAWYSTVFILSSFCLFVLTYFFLNASYRAQNQASINSQMLKLISLYQAGGAALIEQENRVEKKFAQEDRFFIRIADPRNTTLFLNIPYQWADFDIKRLESTDPSSIEEWFRLPPSSGGPNYLELARVRLPDGNWLQVGKTAEEQVKLLQRFRKTFMLVVVPFVLFGLIGGAAFSFRALRPIRHLIQTVRSIDLDTMTARVPSPHSNDELDELVRLFNEMLSRIEALILAMRGSLDHVAHDLRTPMTRLRGIAEMALRSEMCDPDILREALSDCVEESEKVLTLLNTLMDISEAETGAMALRKRTFSVNELIERVVELYEVVAEEKGIEVSVSAPADLVLTADQTRVGQALANLLDNALKYTTDGGKIHLEARVENDEMVIGITDTGVGIPEENLSKIWDRLYRGDKSRSQKGLGLGLSLVKAIVEAHKGRIQVDSRTDRGSSFTIFLPIRA